MKVTRINSKELAEAIGPYVHGSLFNDLIVTSGQIPVYKETGEVEEDVTKATKLALENMLAVVESGGGSKESILKVDIFVTNINDFAEINEAYGEFFGGNYPARVLVEIGTIPGGSLLEVACMAAKEG